MLFQTKGVLASLHCHLVHELTFFYGVMGGGGGVGGLLRG